MAEPSPAPMCDHVCQKQVSFQFSFLPTNYRPISVIPVVAKVFERIIHDQLYHCLSTSSFLSDHQSGFRSLHSTFTALIEATNTWAMDIDRGHVNAVFYLDLQKSFDTVDNDIL